MLDIAVILIIVAVITVATVLYLRFEIKKPDQETDKKFVETVKKIRRKYGLGPS